MNDIVLPDPTREKNFEVEALTAVKEDDEANVSDRVFISFKSFMDLVASHSYNTVIENFSDSRLTVSSELLTALANAHETKSEKKIPLIFSIGLIVGVIITYLLIHY